MSDTLPFNRRSLHSACAAVGMTGPILEHWRALHLSSEPQFSHPPKGKDLPRRRHSKPAYPEARYAVY
ncbi:MAG: hypothetical protein JJU13_18440 [Balneolaceae bacterium]|nr:hypothetical protein [Balneolaceae bacterium]